MFGTRRFWNFSCFVGLASCLLFSGTSLATAQPDARQVMAEVTQARKLVGSEAVVEMTIFSSSGAARHRKLRMATKLYEGEKTEKRVYQFLEPSDVKGTGVLVFDHETQADDVWIYMPALGKTRRIIASQRAKSFMGSEFTYGDLNLPQLDDYTYRRVRDENAGGEPCVMIEVLPKSAQTAKEEGYSKKQLWISKKTHVIRRGLYFDLKGKVLKELTTSGVKLLDASKHRYRASRMEMKNQQNKRRSVFETTKIAFSPKVKDEFFSKQWLERI